MSKTTSPERGGKGVQVKVRNVTRAMTAATLLATLPRGSRVLAIILSGVDSDATSTATVSIGTSTTSTELVSAYDVKGSGNGVNLLNGVAGAVGAYTRSNSPVSIYAKYAETGTASTVGHWQAYILYTTGNFENDDTV